MSEYVSRKRGLFLAVVATCIGVGACQDTRPPTQVGAAVRSRIGQTMDRKIDIRTGRVERLNSESKVVGGRAGPGTGPGPRAPGGRRGAHSTGGGPWRAGAAGGARGDG